jgi:hypothetical protein
LIEYASDPGSVSAWRWDDVCDGGFHILHGKTANARRVIPLSNHAAKEIKDSKVAAFVFYEVHHTCLKRRVPHMDPYTLGYVAGHGPPRMTKRYVHPQAETVKAAIEKGSGGHTSGHSEQKAERAALRLSP